MASRQAHSRCISFPDGGTCTITEPDSAGATSVKLECGPIDPDNLDITCTEKGDALEVKVPNDLSLLDEATVSLTVTNDFTKPPPPTPSPAPEAAPTTTAPPPAPPVKAAATFTG